MAHRPWIGHPTTAAPLLQLLSHLAMAMSSELDICNGKLCQDVICYHYKSAPMQHVQPSEAPAMATLSLVTMLRQDVSYSSASYHHRSSWIPWRLWQWQSLWDCPLH